MITNKEKKTWIQCTDCGKMYYIKKNVPIDKLYVVSVCPRCNCEKGLNCGNDEEDVYLYVNVNVDPRYYQY